MMTENEDGGAKFGNTTVSHCPYSWRIACVQPRGVVESERKALANAKMRPTV